MIAHRLSVAGLLIAPAAALVFAAAQGCGAQDLEGPPATPHPEQCRSLDELAPALFKALSSDNLVRLRTFIERNKLLDPLADGSPAPAVVVLGVVLNSLTAMSHDPTEAGSPPGQLCNFTSPPEPRDANRMCEMRRIIKRFVREGKGLAALHSLDPVLKGTLGYIVGAPPMGATHYEVAGVLQASCSKANCRTEDVLDMATGLLSFLEPTSAQPNRPKELLAQINALLNHEKLKPLMDSMSTGMTVDGKTGEDGVIALGNLLINNTKAIGTTKAAFEHDYHCNIEVQLNSTLGSLVNWSDPAYASLRTMLDQFIGAHTDCNAPHNGAHSLLYDMLDPTRPEPLLVPMQKVLACSQENDPNSALMKMVYQLAFVEDTLGLKNLMGAIEQVANQDDRLAILTFTKTLLKMIRADEEGTAAARKLCAQALDTHPPADGGRTNAQLVLPVAYDLFAAGATSELICVADTLLFGCAGGSQPACAP